jgi:hypothetical protein
MLSRANNTKCVRSALARSKQTNTSACTRNVVTSADTIQQSKAKKGQPEAELHTLEAELQNNKKYPAVADIYC